MDNSYTSQYMPNGFEDANQQGLNPVFQNTNTQQQYLNQQLGQGNQMSQPTSHAPNFSGLNPLSMAMALRNQDPYAANKGDPYLNANTAMSKYGAGNVYGYGGQGQIPAWNGEM
jgi:hypothetical protein